MKKRILTALAILMIAMIALTAASAETYTKLRPGDTGPEVLRLQTALKSLGYDVGALDGQYGAKTEQAVRSFQRTYGLTVDGYAGVLTQKKLYTVAKANTGDSAGQTATANGWFSGDYATIERGQNGPRVQLLQAALHKLGYYTGSIDGRFGSGTRSAVCAFQKASGLAQDGKAGWKTLQRIEGALGSDNTVAAATRYLSDHTASSSGNSQAAQPAASARTTSAVSADGSMPARPSRTLRPGDSGADVISLQTRLQQLGYYTGALTGTYDQKTKDAVTTFQVRCGLKADGIAGSKTYGRLFTSSAPASASVSVSATVAPNQKALQKSTNQYLKLGSSGSAVTQMQTSLKALGYTVTINGRFDNATDTAVRAFQKRNRLYVDGIAGPDTLTALYSGNCVGPGPDPTPAPANAGRMAASEVGEIKLLHWFNDVKPTLKSGQTILVYDPATGLSWKLRLLSLGRHADAEPLTLQDTQVMVRAFGNKNTWDQKAVYVRLPNGVWTLASTHDMPHLSGSIKDNGFNGHLCVHFLRDMDECKKNDPNYGVSNQRTIRNKWKELTGETVD